MSTARSNASRSLMAAAALGLLSTGCAAQLDTGGGVTVPEKRDVHAMWTGTASAHVHLLGPGHNWRVGMEVAQRSEYEYGSTWTSGMQLGYIYNPDPGRGVGGSVYADFGSTLRDSGMFNDGELYAGASGELILWLFGERDAADINASPWLLVRKPEVVIFGRSRVYRGYDEAADEYTIDQDYTGGLGLRMRLLSDFLVF